MDDAAREEHADIPAGLRIVVVAVFLNEARYLPVFLESMAAQTRVPDLVVLADDGSTDLSGEIASAFATANDRFQYLRLPSRRPGKDRLAAANELKAFQTAVAELAGGFDVIAKMDTDLDLPARAIETLEQAFLSDEQLGMAGLRLSEREPDGTLKPTLSRPEHVEGATKFYRRACWNDISPIQPILGWDTFDKHHARMHGWYTHSYEVPGGDTIHLRPMGSHGSILRSFRRWGVCSYGYGAHPLQVAWYAFVLARKRKPRVIGAIHYLLGWAGAWMRRAPRADPEIRAAIQRSQLERLRRRLGNA
jgi:biofilm PGA synthesis N-glycosyltransferase PgaC